MGFCEEHAWLNLAIGWDEQSWGWHGDDGDAFAGNVYDTFGPPYGERNTIRCGVDFDDESAFFTRDGEIVGSCPGRGWHY